MTRRMRVTFPVCGSYSTGLKDYADVDSLIDYLIATYALGLNEHYYHDVLFATYDDGPFIASLFDMGSQHPEAYTQDTPRSSRTRATQGDD